MLDAEPLPGEAGAPARKSVCMELPSPSAKLLKGMKQLNSRAGDAAAEDSSDAAAGGGGEAGAGGGRTVATGAAGAKGGKKQVSSGGLSCLKWLHGVCCK